MAFAETANLAVKLTLGGNFTSQMAKATGSLGAFNRDASRAYKAGGQIGTGIKRGAVLAAAGVGVLVSQIGFGLDALIQLESATAQTDAALRSTKGAAGQTANSIRNLAEKYEGLNATIDDKVIQSGENVLLTFTNIRKKAFEPALAAALDLSTAMGQDLQSSIVQVGKALNDPIRGVTALRRIGVQLSPQQEKQIKTFVKQGKVMQAQQVILKELNKEFGGSFLAGGSTTAGKVAKFGDSIEDLQKSLATALLPAISNIADGLNDLFRDPATITAAQNLGKDIGKLFSPANISKGISLLKEGFGALKSIAGPIAEVIGTAIKAFTSLPPEVQKLLVGGLVVNKLTGGLVTNVAGGIIETLTKGLLGGVKAPLVNVSGGVVNVGGVPGGAGIGAAATGLSAIQKVFLVGEAIGLAVAVDEVRAGIEKETTSHAQSITTQTAAYIASQPSKAGLETSLAGINAGIQKLESDPIGTALIAGPALEELRKMRSAIVTALTDPTRRVDDNPSVGNFRPPQTPLKDQNPSVGNFIKTLAATEPAKAKTADIESLRGKVSDDLVTGIAATTTAGTKTAAATTAAGTKTAGATVLGAFLGAGATRQGSSSIVGAIQANRPVVSTNVVVNVTASGITKTVTVSQRYGPVGGSRIQDGSGTLHNGAN